MGYDTGLLSALTACFWTYASLILPEGEQRALQALVRQAGGAVPARIPAPEGHEPDQIPVLVEVAFSSVGAPFVRHAGYYCGGQLARKFVTSVPHPSDEAVRLFEAALKPFGGIHFVADTPEPDRLDFTVGSKAPLPRSFTEFALGFVRGAAVRINEGVPPTITERVEQHDRNWVVSVVWSQPEAALSNAPKGGSKTRRR